jgi:hypothetical protein
MESGIEVLRVTSAIVSAFSTAADAVEFIKDRKEKKKRKKEKEVEELLQIRILHKSLVEVNLPTPSAELAINFDRLQGGTRCRKHCENRNEQYRPAFGAGDDIAIQALKEVVISLQTEVMQPLHVARAVENAVLDFTTLHESSITNRKDATRAMDQLCQRIMASTQYLPQHGAYPLGAVGSSNISMQSSYTSAPVSDMIDLYDLPPSPPPSVGSPPISNEQHASSQQASSFQVSNYELAQKKAKGPQRSPLAYISHEVRPSSTLDPDAPRGNGQLWTEQRSSYHNTDSLQLERTSYTSTRYTPSESDRGSTRLQPGTIHSTITSRYSHETPSRAPSTSEPPAYCPQERPIAPQKLTTQYSEKETQDYEKQDYGGYFGGDPETSTIRSKPLPPAPSLRIETKETKQQSKCASEAPEVIPDYTGAQTLSPRVDEFTEKFPSPRIQPDYNARLQSLPVGMDNIWTPLSRPAMHNRYHGFCKGAWQIRKVVRHASIGYT